MGGKYMYIHIFRQNFVYVNHYKHLIFISFNALTFNAKQLSVNDHDDLV